MTSKYIAAPFYIVCILSTASLLAYCTWKYLKDESNSLTDFQVFHATEKDIYPTMSLCFQGKGIYDRKKLKQIYKSRNVTRYVSFLKGRHWDERLLGVDYDDVTINLKDYVESVSVRINSYYYRPVVLCTTGRRE